MPTDPSFPPLAWLSAHPLAAGLLALGLLLLVGLVVGLLRSRSRRAREALPPSKPAAELPPEAPKVVLPPSEEETARRAEAEEKRRRAEALEGERLKLARAARGAEAEEKEALEAKAKALKEEEEAAKREAYRAQKAAEEEAKDRRARERAEVERLQAEEAQRAAEESRLKAEAEKAAAQKKVEAEAGRTLADGLARTRSQGFMARLNQLLQGDKAVDESVLAELEEVLFTADIGVRTASRLMELARDGLKAKELGNPEKVKAFLRREVERILALPKPRSLEGGGPPHVVMVVGVNGAGKTTTIGKLAAKANTEGKKVVVAAGDTFRAAATEQLDVWAERAQAQLVKGPEGADPGSVVFEAVQKAKNEGAAIVLADTAGRLHTKAPLMEELKKVRRVMDKALPGAPHEVLLVLDATMGQNAIAQAKQFQESVSVTGIALTKLDGTAKGGVIIGICDELKIPVSWVGVGEKVADLKPFDPSEFVQALFDTTPLVSDR
jgi:fused signal recognition particle receptor